jgi:hypothetical protein
VVVLVAMWANLIDDGEGKARRLCGVSRDMPAITGKWFARGMAIG